MITCKVVPLVICWFSHLISSTYAPYIHTIDANVLSMARPCTPLAVCRRRTAWLRRPRDLLSLKMGLVPENIRETHKFDAQKGNDQEPLQVWYLKNVEKNFKAGLPSGNLTVRYGKIHLF